MTKLEKLIAELCPNGVEFRKLGDLQSENKIKLGRGRVISKRDLQEDPGAFPVYSSSAIGDGKFGEYGKFDFDEELISWSIDGGGKFFFRPKHKFSVTNVSGFLIVEDKTISAKYLYYALINEWKRKVFNYTVKAHPSVVAREYEIPVPPLEVQEEIVRILDKFTQLEAELEAELEARKKQYSHYRNALLSFENPEDAVGIEWAALKNVAKIKNGKDWKTAGRGKVPVYGSGGIMSQTVSKIAYSKPTVLIPRKGTITNIFYTEKPFWNVDTIYYTEIDNSLILPKFFFYFMDNFDLKKLDTGKSGRPSLTQSVLNEIKIPLPPLERQKEIVEILDKFEKLTNDISKGLPAEIAARRKQYEYYRNKLLTFNELP